MIKLPNEEELDPGEVLLPLRRHDFMNGVRFTLAEVQRLNATVQVDVIERESMKNLKWLFDLSKTCHALGIPLRLSDSQVEKIAEGFLELEQRLNAAAQPVNDGLVPVPDEFLYADQNAKGMFELSEDCMCRLSVALSQQSKGLVVKPGYALLPIEPTEKMLAAGSATDGGLYCIWKDMIAAAPGGQDD